MQTGHAARCHGWPPWLPLAIPAQGLCTHCPSGMLSTLQVCSAERLSHAPRLHPHNKAGVPHERPLLYQSFTPGLPQIQTPQIPVKYLWFIPGIIRIPFQGSQLQIHSPSKNRVSPRHLRKLHPPARFHLAVGSQRTEPVSWEHATGRKSSTQHRATSWDGVQLLT